MNRIQILGLSIVVVGFIVSGIGTFIGSDWNVNNLMGKGGPYARSVGLIGLVIVMGGFYLMSYEKTKIS